MTDDSVLRQKARNAIQAGALPNRPPDRLWGGPATGACCAICQEPTIDREFEFAYDGDGSCQTLFAHPRCWRAFEMELENSSGLNGFDQARTSRAEPAAGDLLHAGRG